MGFRRLAWVGAAVKGLAELRTALREQCDARRLVWVGADVGGLAERQPALGG